MTIGLLPVNVVSVGFDEFNNDEIIEANSSGVLKEYVRKLITKRTKKFLHNIISNAMICSVVYELKQIIHHIESIGIFEVGRFKHHLVVYDCTIEANIVDSFNNEVYA
jgi:hypothetical protein